MCIDDCESDFHGHTDSSQSKENSKNHAANVCSTRDEDSADLDEEGELNGDDFEEFEGLRHD